MTLVRIQHLLTNVGRLDHAHIVRAIPDRQRHRAKTFLDEPDDQCLLQRGDTTADDGFALDRETQEEALAVFVGEGL